MNNTFFLKKYIAYIKKHTQLKATNTLASSFVGISSLTGNIFWWLFESWWLESWLYYKFQEYDTEYKIISK